MTGLEYDYDNLDKLIYKDKTCSQMVITMIKLKAFESVLRKSPNISSIGIQNRRFGYFINNKMIQLITDLCKNLTQIDLVFDWFTKDNYNRFVAKFGPNLKRCDFYSGYYLEYRYFGDLLTRCSKLENLNLLGNFRNYFIRANFTHKFENLKSLSFWLCGHKGRVIAENLMTDSKLTLERIDIWVYTTMEEDMEMVFNRIYTLSNLKSLKFDFNTDSQSNYWSRDLPFYMDQLFPIQLSMTALVCPNVKKIEIIGHSSLSVCSQVYESMKDFHHLKRLNLYFRYTTSDIEYNYLIETLKDCKQLTHLSLDFPEISQDFLQNIEIYFTKIQFISLKKVSNIFTLHDYEYLKKLKCVYVL